MSRPDQVVRYFRWVRKVGRVGSSGRFGMVWSKFWSWIQHSQSVSQWVSDQGGYRAARAAKNPNNAGRKANTENLVCALLHGLMWSEAMQDHKIQLLHQYIGHAKFASQTPVDTVGRHRSKMTIGQRSAYVHSPVMEASKRLMLVRPGANYFLSKSTSLQS